MELLFSSFFLPVQSIIFLITSLFLTLSWGYYLFDKVRAYFHKSQELKKLRESVQETTVISDDLHQELIPQNQDNSTDLVSEKNWELSHVQKQELSDLIKLIQTKIARSEYAEAKQKIISWLSIDKFHKELNCMLASLYEWESDFKKAEIVYRDLILVYDVDIELYLKLWFVLSVQKKYEIAHEIYKKLLTIEENHQEALEMCSHLATQLELHEEAKTYSKMYLKQNPNSVEVLKLLLDNLLILEEHQEALEILRKIKHIEPYNNRVRELIDKLETESQLADNFKTNN
jgi:tetratricopeptide (TPR) repeat protein